MQTRAKPYWPSTPQACILSFRQGLT
ncbi:hypothetical protein BOS5A_230963 [Bosea sp. EC-HK365B]|nr:hypothetical protein BOSE7B_50459 [Bosea sp. 7B]VVT61686.1 hypothetical protein BOS5A_230963 [Bosea sp. EC-HK365B]VXB05710.1 hypothetical protein BOSE127_100128 [Bosea sp. 127]